MALNKVYDEGRHLPVVCSFPATPASGDPVLVGSIPGVAVINERADGITTVDFGGVYTLPVTAAAGAIAVGAPLYASQASPVVISNTNTGIPFGFALQALGNGVTGNINVRIFPHGIQP